MSCISIIDCLLTNVTGYKLRTHIAKALQTRSEAIRRALTNYNTEARKLKPPQPKLTWEEIVEYSFLAEFDLLRNARTDIRTKLWTDPSRREATIKYLRLQRAKEEVERLNREVRRLRTSIHDESHEMEACIKHTAHTDPPLAVEIANHWQLRSKVNAVIIGYLDRIEAMPGFSGVRGVGTRLYSDQAQFPRAPHVLSATAVKQEQTDTGDVASSSVADPLVDEILADGMSHVELQDDEVVNELEGMVEFVCNIND